VSDPLRVEALGTDHRPRVRRLASRGLAIAIAAALLAGVGFSLTFSGLLLWITAIAGASGFASFLALFAARLLPAPSLHPGAATLEAGALHLRRGDHPRVLRLADIAQGWREDPDAVHLALRSGDVVVLRMPDATSADALLRAAGLGAGERVLRVPLASAASQVPGGSAFGGALLALLGGGLFFAVIALAAMVRHAGAAVAAPALGEFTTITGAAALLGAAAWLVASALRRREAVIGTDGIAYRKSLRTEFIPYAALDRVHLDTRGAMLALRDGRRVLLPIRTAGARPMPLSARRVPPRNADEAQRRVLLDRIEEAMNARDPAAAAHVTLDRLDRSGRTAAAWKDDLAGLLRTESDYRNLRISAEDLGEVIVDARAPVARRVAAAVALAPGHADEARRRVRIAVEASADTDLRAALEQAAEGEIDETAIARAESRRR
jgi:hypothetical protein